MVVGVQEMLRDQATFELVTTEIFGPFQIVTSYNDTTLPKGEDTGSQPAGHQTGIRRRKRAVGC